MIAPSSFYLVVQRLRMVPASNGALLRLYYCYYYYYYYSSSSSYSSSGAAIFVFIIKVAIWELTHLVKQ